MGFWPGIMSITRCCGGLWRVLIVRICGRTAIELERERNRATVTAIKLLPVGAELLEYEAAGRLRVIRMPEPTSPPLVVMHDTPIQAKR
jgi:hypothetical protein